MKDLTRSLGVALCLCTAFLMSGVIFSKAQFSPKDNLTAEKKSVSKPFSEIIYQKRETAPLALLTAKDLSKISAGKLETSLVNGDPCETATQISFGQTVNGQLSSTDCRLDDNSYADFYYFNGTQGQQVTVAMNSTAFDSYLGLADETGTFVVEDDDGGGGTNSRIVATLPQTGLYIILANSVFANQFGNYSVSLTGSMVCTYSLEPTSANVPAAGGDFTFMVNTQPGCQWGVSTNDHYFITTNSTGVGSGTVTYSVSANGNETPRVGTIKVGGQTFTVNQSAAVCAVTITPSSVTVPAVRTSGSFTVTTPVGCYWRPDSPDLFVSYDGGGGNRGSGIVNYTVSTNNGTDRTGTITVGNQVFTITQPGLNCTFSVSPTSISANRFGHVGTVSVTTQPDCAWSVSRSEWIIIDSINAAGSGTFSYRILEYFGTVPRAGVIPIFGRLNLRVNVTQTGTLYRTQTDFDGDGKSDISVFRPSTGSWYLLQSSNSSFFGLSFGIESDVITPADFDGDSKTDIAVFRHSNGTWYLQQSTAGFTGLQFGQNGDVPVPADYDGDGKADIAVYRPSTGSWYRLNSSNGQFLGIGFGTSEDKPTIGDFDGDGKSDIAVFRPSTGSWYRLNSSNNQFVAVQFGVAEDKPVPADFDGDGKTDVAVFRPSTGSWYRLNSSNGEFVAVQFGIAEDKPVPADYDGDGKADIAVFRPSGGNWYLLRSADGFSAVQFGVGEDKPTSNAFIQN